MNPILRLSSASGGRRAVTGSRCLLSRYSSVTPLSTSTVPFSRRTYAASSDGGNDQSGGQQPASQRTREIEHPGPPPPIPSKREQAQEQEQEQEPNPEPGTASLSFASTSSSSSPPSLSASPSGDLPGQQAQQQPQESNNSPPIPSNKARPTLTDGRQSPNVDANGNPRADVPEDVRQHNRELEQRYDRAYNQIDDEGTVSKGFWRGKDGVMRSEK